MNTSVEAHAIIKSSEKVELKPKRRRIYKQKKYELVKVSKPQ